MGKNARQFIIGAKENVIKRCWFSKLSMVNLILQYKTHRKKIAVFFEVKPNVTEFRKDETIQLKQNDALCLSVYAENSGGDLDVDLQFKDLLKERNC